MIDRKHVKKSGKDTINIMTAKYFWQILCHHLQKKQKTFRYHIIKI